MKLTIIVDDSAVYKGDKCLTNIDMSSAPANIHALQFSTSLNKGWIEFKGDELGMRPANENIDELPAWAVTIFEKFDEAVVAEAAFISANPININPA